MKLSVLGSEQVKNKVLGASWLPTIILSLVLYFLTQRNLISILLTLIAASFVLSIIFAGNTNKELTILRFVGLNCLLLFLPINPYLNVAISIFLCFLFDLQRYRFKAEAFVRQFKIILIILMLSVTLFEILKKNIQNSLQFLTFGYDNAFHLSILRQFNASGHFYFPISDKGWSDFSLFRSYPTGQGALYSLYSKVIFQSSNLWIDAVACLLTLTFCILIWILFISLKIVKSGNQFKLKTHFYLLPILLMTVVVFPGTLMVNGFPPYVLGLLVIVIYSSGNLPIQDLNLHSQKFSFSIFLLALIFPAGLLFMIVPGCVLVKRIAEQLLQRQCIASNLTSFGFISIFSTVSLWNLWMTSSNLGWRQVYAGGGVQPPNVFATILLAISSSLTFWYVVKNVSRSVLLQTYVSGVLGVFFLCLITIYFTGSIQYYAIKQFYVLAFFSSLLVCLAKTDIHDEKIIQVHRAPILILCISLGITLTTPKIFVGGFMGIPINATKEVLDHNNWTNQIVDATLLTTVQSDPENRDFDCIILISRNGESDLNSRWINALTGEGLVTENCFSAYWNSNSLKIDELVSKLRSLPNSNLLIVGNNSKIMDDKIGNLRIKTIVGPSNQ